MSGGFGTLGAGLLIGTSATQLTAVVEPDVMQLLQAKAVPPASTTVRNSATPSDTHATVGRTKSEAAADAAGATAVQDLWRRLSARRCELQLLVNTNKLLVQRERHAAAALRDARGRGAAQQAQRHTQDLAVSGVLVSAQAGQLTARVQQRLFAAESGAVLGMAAFKAHCRITVDALVRMQGGGSSGELDLSEQNLRVVVDDYRGRVSASIGLECDDICWHLTATRQMAPGAPLSIGLGLTTAACSASLFVMYFLLQLESGLMLEEGTPLRRWCFQPCARHREQPATCIGCMCAGLLHRVLACVQVMPWRQRRPRPMTPVRRVRRLGTGPPPACQRHFQLRREAPARAAPLALLPAVATRTLLTAVRGRQRRALRMPLALPWPSREWRGRASAVVRGRRSAPWMGKSLRRASRRQPGRWPHRAQCELMARTARLHL